MSTQLTAPAMPTKPANESLGIDRAFAIQMARMPLLAVLWIAASFASHQIWAWLAPETANYGPLVVVCAGMILAAFIDGWALKVPNWVTLPLVLSGWGLGLLHDCGITGDGGTGGLVIAMLATGLGFLLLFPMLVIRGVGEGDVKMQMGFAAWAGAFFGTGEVSGLPGLGVVFWAFAFGAVIGGAFALIMILVRRQFRQNMTMFSEIAMDLQMFASGQPVQAAKRAQERRQRWVKLPYGIPLCVGFLLYLAYVLTPR